MEFLMATINSWQISLSKHNIVHNIETRRDLATCSGYTSPGPQLNEISNRPPLKEQTKVFEKCLEENSKRKKDHHVQSNNRSQ
jgi:hypothetical protein